MLEETLKSSMVDAIRTFPARSAAMWLIPLEANPGQMLINRVQCFR